MNLPDSVGAEEYNALRSACDGLAAEDGIKLVFLIYPNGQLLVSSGQAQGIDLTGFAALAAGSMAGAIGIAKLVNEIEFSTLVYEGQQDQLLICGVQKRGILVVHFDRNRALGWVRFQVRKRIEAMALQLELLLAKYAQLRSPMKDVSDDDIDALNFGGP